MIVVIDYKAGNLYNVANALKHLGADFKFSSEPAVVRGARKVILPGVGSARAAMASLDEQDLSDAIRGLTVPFLGICLGQQLLFDSSEEDSTPCLGIIPEKIRRFDHSRLKVPQIGWNRVNWRRDALGENTAACRLIQGLDDGAFFYFVHSYYAPIAEGITFGVTDYDVSFSSAVVRENFIGLQFHPERSGEAGLRLLKNFIEG